MYQQKTELQSLLEEYEDIKDVGLLLSELKKLAGRGTGTQPAGDLREAIGELRRKRNSAVAMNDWEGIGYVRACDDILKLVAAQPADGARNAEGFLDPWLEKYTVDKVPSPEAVRTLRERVCTGLKEAEATWQRWVRQMKRDAAQTGSDVKEHK